MQLSPKFFHAICPPSQRSLVAGRWQEMMLAWDEGRHHYAFQLFLDRIDPSLRIKFGNTSQTEFLVPHETVIVQIVLSADAIEIICPFAIFSDGNHVPSQEENDQYFGKLSHTQLKMDKEGQLSFYYKSPFNSCNPNVIQSALLEICQATERLDDGFFTTYHARQVKEQELNYFSAEVMERIWCQVDEIIDSTFTYITYFDSNKNYVYSIYMLGIAFRQIDYCAPVRGLLKDVLERLIIWLDNDSSDLAQNARDFLTQLRRSGKGNFGKSLYSCEVFITLEKWRRNRAEVQEKILPSLNLVELFRNHEDYVYSSLEALDCIYRLFYLTKMDDDINSILINALSTASEKPWKESNDILYNALLTIKNMS